MPRSANAGTLFEQSVAQHGRYCRCVQFRRRPKQHVNDLWVDTAIKHGGERFADDVITRAYMASVMLNRVICRRQWAMYLPACRHLLLSHALVNWPFAVVVDLHSDCYYTRSLCIKYAFVNKRRFCVLTILRALPTQTHQAFLRDAM